MDVLGSYGGDSDSDNDHVNDSGGSAADGFNHAKAALLPVCMSSLTAAPFVSSALVTHGLDSNKAGSLMLGLNASAEIMSAPHLGPANPFNGAVGDST
jgi:hypothetical protein